jgi:hypothetical protein
MSKAQKSGRIQDLILDRELDSKGKGGQGVKNQKALKAVNREIELEDNPAKLKKLRAAKKKIGQRIKKEGRIRDFSRLIRDYKWL